MSDNISKLSKISKIVNVERLSLPKEIKKLLGPHLTKSAEKNSRKIFVYKIIYKAKGKKIVGYIVEPRKGKSLPCIIWNRGGSRDFGAIKRGQLFGDHSTIAPLALEGYIIIATQYPGVAGGEGIDNWGDDLGISSILDLYKILKEYRRADHTRIGMYGHSRGGAMTYMCLSKVKWIRAAVIGSAPTNEIRSSTWRKNWLKHQKKMYGGSIKERKKRSAIFWTDKLSKKTPILLVHGTADWRVNPLDSIEMANRLYEEKIPYRLIIYEGSDHGIREHFQDYRIQIINWFDKFVKKLDPLPNLKPHGI